MWYNSLKIKISLSLSPILWSYTHFFFFSEDYFYPRLSLRKMTFHCEHVFRCESRNEVSWGKKKCFTFLFDFVVGKLYCSPRHDHFMGCWNYTEAGTRAFLPCPDIPGFAPDRKSITSRSKNRTVISSLLTVSHCLFYRLGYLTRFQ